jgi:hypothetical protein
MMSLVKARISLEAMDQLLFMVLERVQDQQGTRSTGRIRVVYIVISSLDLNSSPVYRALGHAAGIDTRGPTDIGIAFRDCDITQCHTDKEYC